MKPLFIKLPIFCYTPESEERLGKLRDLELPVEEDEEEDYEVIITPVNMNLVEQYQESTTGKTILFLASGVSLYCALEIKKFDELVDNL